MASPVLTYSVRCYQFSICLICRIRAKVRRCPCASAYLRACARTESHVCRSGLRVSSETTRLSMACVPSRQCTVSCSESAVLYPGKYCFGLGKY
eukprot:394865-Rhodomonas_salina.4